LTLNWLLAEVGQRFGQSKWCLYIDSYSMVKKTFPTPSNHVHLSVWLSVCMSVWTLRSQKL